MLTYIKIELDDDIKTIINISDLLYNDLIQIACNELNKNATNPHYHFNNSSISIKGNNSLHAFKMLYNKINIEI